MTALETLRELGPGEEAPEDAKRRVYAGVLLGVSAAATAAAVTAKASASVAPAPLAVAKVSLLSGAGAKLLSGGTLLLLLGGALGAVAYKELGPESVRIVYVDRPVLVSAPAPAAAPDLPPKAEVAAVAPQQAPAPLPKASAEASHGSALARERALLDQARKSSAQGDPEGALAHVERHLHEFPAGHLAEEREAMAVRALLALGRREDARQRAQTFRNTYPNSLLTEVVAPAASGP